MEATHTQIIAGLLKEIDTQIKTFVQAICADTNVDENQVYYKTSFENMCYVVSLYHTEHQQQVQHAIPIDEFLLACQQRQIEDLFNHKIREMLLAFGQSTEDVIYI